MDALRAFFSDADPSTHTVRTQSYAIAMSTVYQRYFELDTESAVFYALALQQSIQIRRLA